MELECRLEKIRKRKKMTQRELSERTGIAITTLSAYENNKWIMSTPTLWTVAKALNCRVDSLYKEIKSSKF